MAIRSKGANEAPKQNNTDHPSQIWESIASERLNDPCSVKRLLMVGCLGLSLLGLTGCTLGSGFRNSFGGSECIGDFMIGYRNRAMAEKAWINFKDTLCNQSHLKEFKDGFIQGYMEIATGGTGCTPLMAPPVYSGWRYQTAGGHSAVNAWFQGFPQGIKAAEQDGVGHWQAIRMNSYSRRPAPLPTAGIVPAVAPHADDPEITNPFYSDPVPVPEGLEEDNPEPNEIEQIEIPHPDEVDSVFDDLFPPVGPGNADGSTSPADAFLAERFDESVSDDSEDDSLPFSFE